MRPDDKKAGRFGGLLGMLMATTGDSGGVFFLDLGLSFITISRELKYFISPALSHPARAV